MYAAGRTHRIADPSWHLTDTLLWRARWTLGALAALALLGLAFLQAARDGAPPAATGQTVTVAAGDTLWSIASARYPDADPRQKVFQIERLNRLSGETIEPGQRLTLPAP
jgi:nucleoid-associated protein YgaU